MASFCKLFLLNFVHFSLSPLVKLSLSLCPNDAASYTNDHIIDGHSSYSCIIFSPFTAQLWTFGPACSTIGQWGHSWLWVCVSCSFRAKRPSACMMVTIVMPSHYKANEMYFPCFLTLWGFLNDNWSFIGHRLIHFGVIYWLTDRWCYFFYCFYPSHPLNRHLTAPHHRQMHTGQKQGAK